MEKRKMCIRCGGRMFLEFDYESRHYDYVCISCGHAETTLLDDLAPQPEKAGREPRKVASLAHV